MMIRKKSILACFGLAFVFLGILVLFKTTTFAQDDSPAGSPVTAVPLQLGRDNFGIAIVDPKAEAIWIYQVNDRGPAHNRLKLFAARNWHYDKMLEEFNSAEPKPQQVKSLIEQMLKTGAAPEANSTELTPVTEPNSKTEK